MCCSRIAGLEAKRGYGAPRTVDQSVAGSVRAACLMRTDARRASRRAARDEASGRGPKPLEARYGCALRQSRAVSLSAHKCLQHLPFVPPRDERSGERRHVPVLDDACGTGDRIAAEWATCTSSRRESKHAVTEANKSALQTTRSHTSRASLACLGLAGFVVQAGHVGRSRGGARAASTSCAGSGEPPE